MKGLPHGLLEVETPQTSICIVQVKPCPFFATSERTDQNVGENDDSSNRIIVNFILYLEDNLQDPLHCNTAKTIYTLTSF